MATRPIPMVKGSTDCVVQTLVQHLWRTVGLAKLLTFLLTLVYVDKDPYKHPHRWHGKGGKDVRYDESIFFLLSPF